MEDIDHFTQLREVQYHELQTRLHLFLHDVFPATLKAKGKHHLLEVYVALLKSDNFLAHFTSLLVSAPNLRDLKYVCKMFALPVGLREHLIQECWSLARGLAPGKFVNSVHILAEIHFPMKSGSDIVEISDAMSSPHTYVVSYRDCIFLMQRVETCNVAHVLRCLELPHHDCIGPPILLIYIESCPYALHEYHSSSQVFASLQETKSQRLVFTDRDGFEAMLCICSAVMHLHANHITHGNINTHAVLLTARTNAQDGVKWKWRLLLCQSSSILPMHDLSAPTSSAQICPKDDVTCLAMLLLDILCSGRRASISANAHPLKDPKLSINAAFDASPLNDRTLAPLKQCLLNALQGASSAEPVTAASMYEQVKKSYETYFKTLLPASVPETPVLSISQYACSCYTAGQFATALECWRRSGDFYNYITCLYVTGAIGHKLMSSALEFCANYIDNYSMFSRGKSSTIPQSWLAPPSSTVTAIEQQCTSIVHTSAIEQILYQNNALYLATPLSTAYVLPTESVMQYVHLPTPHHTLNYTISVTPGVTIHTVISNVEHITMRVTSAEPTAQQDRHTIVCINISEMLDVEGQYVFVERIVNTQVLSTGSATGAPDKPHVYLILLECRKLTSDQLDNGDVVGDCDAVSDSGVPNDTSSSINDETESTTALLPLRRFYYLLTVSAGSADTVNYLAREIIDIYHDQRPSTMCVLAGGRLIIGGSCGLVGIAMYANTRAAASDPIRIEQLNVDKYIMDECVLDAPLYHRRSSVVCSISATDSGLFTTGDSEGRLVLWKYSSGSHSPHAVTPAIKLRARIITTAIVSTTHVVVALPHELHLLALNAETLQPVLFIQQTLDSTPNALYGFYFNRELHLCRVSDVPGTGRLCVKRWAQPLLPASRTLQSNAIRLSALSFHCDESNTRRSYFAVLENMHRLVLTERFATALSEFASLPNVYMTPQMIDLYIQLTSRVRVLLKGSRVSFYECCIPDEVETMRNSPNSSSSSGARSPPKTRRDGNVRAVANFGLVAYTRDYTSLMVRDLNANELLGTVRFTHPLFCDVVIQEVMFTSAHMLLVVYHCKSTIACLEGCSARSVIATYDLETMALSGYIEQTLLVDNVILEHNNAVLRVNFADGSVIAFAILSSQLSALPDPPTGIIGVWRRMMCKSSSTYAPDASAMVNLVPLDEYFAWKEECREKLESQPIHGVTMNNYVWHAHHKLLWIHGPRNSGKSTMLHALRLQMPSVYHCYVCGTSHSDGIMCSYNRAHAETFAQTSHKSNFDLIMSLYHQFAAMLGHEYRSLAIAELESCVSELRAADASDLDPDNVSFAVLLQSMLVRVSVTEYEHIVLPDLRLLNIEVLFDCLLSRPLTLINHRPDDDITIMIDNIDSLYAVTAESGIFYIIQLLCLSTPEWVRIIFPSVQVIVYNRIFSVVPHQTIAVEGIWSKDILNPIISRCLQKCSYSDDKTAAVDSIMNVVGCNINLVDTIFEFSIHNSADLTCRLENINVNRIILSEHYNRDNSESYCRACSVMEVLGACFDNPTVDTIADALELSLQELHAVIDIDLSPVLQMNSTDNTLTAVNYPLLLYLRSQYRINQPFALNISNGHNYLATVYLRHCSNKSIAVDHPAQIYLKQHGPTHLARSNRSLSLLTANIRKIDETSGLRDFLPAQIGYITGLQEIYARRVGVSGPIPREFGHLSQLRVLSMGNNRISGPLPSSLGRLTKLQRIVLHQNRLTGQVPESICQLGCIVNLAGNPGLLHSTDVPLSERRALEDLYRLTQGEGWHCNMGWMNNHVPVSRWYKVGVLGSHVHSVVMSSNNMVGMLPQSISALTQLRMIELATMPGLSGTISASLCSLVHLRRLCICRCGMTGSIPPEIGNLIQLEELQLFGNSLTGKVPETIGQLVNLRLLSLGEYTGGNTFTPDALPSCFSKLHNLEALFMANCRLRGPLPTWIGEMTELRQLDLQRNNISGVIPKSIGKLVNLLYLNLKDNASITGPLPVRQLCKLSRLNRLSLVHCGFTPGGYEDAIDELQSRLPRCRIWI